MLQEQKTFRKVPLVVISDVHLGTYGCHASELVIYLKSISPEVLILNGDIIDGWQFNKRYWPSSHHQVLSAIMKMISRGTTVYYLTGNHDEMLRKFSDFNMGNFYLVDKLVLQLDGKKAWIFHGDVFDLSVNTGKWLAKIAGKSYDYIILLNRAVNWILEKAGREKVSISKKIKAGVKKAVKFIDDFEETAALHAIDQSYDYVICGHIHQPQIRRVENQNGSVLYLNSGDWIENLTALEYDKGEWKIYQHKSEKKQIVKKEYTQLEPAVSEFFLENETMVVLNTI
jgi:UDP-2,3-diacylglucosamine pyrophosphatase LpxH